MARWPRIQLSGRLALVLPLLIWTGLVGLSAWWSVARIEHQSEITALQRGRDLFQMIELTREWNASRHGVYAPVSQENPPNPYLTSVRRDIPVSDELQLTMVNPAYMTRQLSELARKRGFYFHITSNEPLRPGNSPDAWERTALTAFEKGLAEKIDLFESAVGSTYRYMAPLRVLPACLGCHAVQGYKLDDIRGGISVNIDADPILAAASASKVTVLIAHAAMWQVVSLLLVATVRSTRQHLAVLNASQQAQAREIYDHKHSLAQANDEIARLKTTDRATGLYNAEYFHKALQEALDRAEARGLGYGLLLVDIDYLDAFNEEYGILEGDVLLRSVGNAIRGELGSDGVIIGRHAGVSFALGWLGVPERTLLISAERIKQVVFGLGIRNERSKRAKFVTVSVGAAYRPVGHQDDADVLTKRAVIALRGAKTGGSSRVAS